MAQSNPGNRPKQPSLSQLRAFAAVAEYLHFRDAAAAIGMSQPALSGAVSALEEALGAQLIERTTRKVLLSPAGERLAVRARVVLDAVGELMEEAEAVRAPFTGVLRLGVIPTVAPYLLPAVLRLVHERYPALDLQVHEEQTSSLIEGLGAGRLDLLLLAVPLGRVRNVPPGPRRLARTLAAPAEIPSTSSTRDVGRHAESTHHAPQATPSGRTAGHPGHDLGVPGVSELPLFDEDFVLVMDRGHPLGGRADIPRDALRKLPLLLLDEGHCLRDQALDICREAGRTEGTPVTTTAAGLSTLVQLVAGGLGVTLLPRTAVTVETARNEALTTGYFADPAPTRRVALAMRTGAARHEEFEELAGALRETMRGLPVRVTEGGRM
ncbi:hydrogen peroxide-inducible genes activator [Streptomyces sp. NPDC097595]|uniref:hydrogen peroxide-inducible genes activator n=1 Tax=Streptomyces sp. NPDC097595 TaxID=3366090 RepID=UPI00381982B1